MPSAWPPRHQPSHHSTAPHNSTHPQYNTASLCFGKGCVLLDRPGVCFYFYVVSGCVLALCVVSMMHTCPADWGWRLCMWWVPALMHALKSFTCTAGFARGKAICSTATYCDGAATTLARVDVSRVPSAWSRSRTPALSGNKKTAAFPSRPYPSPGHCCWCLAYMHTSACHDLRNVWPLKVRWLQTMMERSHWLCGVS